MQIGRTKGDCGRAHTCARDRRVSGQTRPVLSAKTWGEGEGDGDGDGDGEGEGEGEGEGAMILTTCPLLRNLRYMGDACEIHRE